MATRQGLAMTTPWGDISFELIKPVGESAILRLLDAYGEPRRAVSS